MSRDPYQSYSFHLLMEGIVIGGFMEASGLTAKTEVIAYPEEDDGSRVRHLPGAVNYSPLELRFGVTASSELLDWFNAISTGQVARRDISLLMYVNDGTTEMCRWNLFSAWPAQYRAAPLSGTSDDFAIEAVTFVYDRLERD